jgi:AGZA family xanthine/uracil permease-like MFS transporter
LFVGAAGIFGFFDVIFLLIPKAVIFPILIFIGLEITAQSFHATPVRHYPAVALACVPALAYLGVLAVNQVLTVPGISFEALPPENQRWIQTVTVIAGGGTFILTSLLWATMLANLIDGRVRAASVALFVGGMMAFFGIIHSPLSSAPIAWPATVVEQLRESGRLAATSGQTPYHWSAAYTMSAVALLVLGRFGVSPRISESGSS